jgi:ABC-type transport system substrate-binding protein
MRTLFRLVLCLAIVSSIFVGTESAPEHPAGPVDTLSRITVVRSSKVHDLDPHRTSSSGDVEVLSHIYEGLIRLTRDGQGFEPVLATSWKVSDESRHYEFVLRDGVKFHDGATLDAEAVVRGLRRMTDQDAPSRPMVGRPYRHEFFSHVESVEADGDNKVVITLSQSDPYFLNTLTLHCSAIISPKLLTHLEGVAMEERHNVMRARPAGTGPFRLGELRTDEHVVLTAFEGYHGGAPVAERLELRTVVDNQRRLRLLASGEADIAWDLPPALAGSVSENDALRLHATPGHNLCYLAMNCDGDSRFVTADKRVREAIALAIDRAPLVELFGGHARPQHILLPKGTPGHVEGFTPDTDTLPREEALARARELILEARASGMILPMFVPDTPRPYLMFPDKVADLLRQQLAAIGLRVEIETAPLVELVMGVHSNRFGLVLIGWMSDFMVPTSYWAPLLGSYDGRPAGNNMARFADGDVAAKIEEARTAPSTEAAERIIEDLERTVHNRHRPIVPLLSASVLSASRADGPGLSPTAQGTWRFTRD